MAPKVGRGALSAPQVNNGAPRADGAVRKPHPEVINCPNGPFVGPGQSFLSQVAQSFVVLALLWQHGAAFSVGEAVS